MCSLLLDEFNETVDRSVSGIFDRRVLLAGRVEFDCGETFDIIRDVIESGIAFSDGNFVSIFGISARELFVFGSKSLAVATLI
jgi:hypothetical protein